MYFCSDWRDRESAEASTSSEVLQTVFGKLSDFFQVPEIKSSNSALTSEDKASKLLNVQWISGNALKLLNWTNRILVLDVPSNSWDGQATDYKQKYQPSNAEEDWSAHGHLITPNPQEHSPTPTPLRMRSIQPSTADDEPPFIDRPYVMPESFKSSIAVSLTRTRWCTRIKEGLMETIKARRID